MKNADFMYKQMLLAEARKCKWPKAATMLVKCFWRLGIPEVWTALLVTFIVVAAVCIIALAGAILHVAFVTYL
mgnify:CR=1 FL=1